MVDFTTKKRIILTENDYCDSIDQLEVFMKKIVSVFFVVLFVASTVFSQSSRPINPAISLERAIEIASADLAARDISATFHRHSGMDWERGQWVWELEFRPNNQRGVIEYYINVHTGAIVKFEWDR